MSEQPENGTPVPGAQRKVTIDQKKWSVLMVVELCASQLEIASAQCGQDNVKELEASTVLGRLAMELRSYAQTFLQKQIQSVQSPSLVELVKFSKKE